MLVRLCIPSTAAVLWLCCRFWPLAVGFPFAMYAKVGASSATPYSSIGRVCSHSFAPPRCQPVPAAPQLLLPQVYKTTGPMLLLMKVTAFVMFLVAVAATIASCQNIIVSWSTYHFFQTEAQPSP